ncbi:hypothetical protein [Streptomyces sp. NPDC059063]|uniref:hypothetical protein n=1 Tax=unclassified Streptomyces TaxID=2593676 RepID=UPI0036CD2BE2
MHAQPRAHRSRRTAFAALCIATAATVTLTACGGDSDKDGKKTGKATESKAPFAGLSGPDIVAKSVKATTGAKSLTLKGSTPDGQGSVVDMDIALSTRGECVGTLSVGGQGQLDLIGNRTSVYMRPDAEFIRTDAKGESKEDTKAAVDTMADRWSKMSAKSSDAKDLAVFCDLDTILGEFKGVDSTARRGKETTVDGTPALTLHESEGKDRYTIYVATEGKPYLLKVVNETAKKPETLTFTDYDKPVKATAPKGDVLDLDKLENLDDPKNQDELDKLTG